METLVITAQEELDVNIKDGNIIYDGNIRCECDIVIKGNLTCRGNLTCHTLFWSHISKPNIRGEMNIKRVLPPAWQRSYWQERLAGIVEISDMGCYEDILKVLIPKLNEILKLDKWTPTERWILESLKK